MSSSERPSRRTTLSGLLGLLALGGCGFTPVYGTGGPGNALRGAVAYEVPESVDGYNLGKQLQNRLGLSGGATYVLAVTISVVDAAGAIDSSNASSRISQQGTARWTLRDVNGTAIADGEVSAFSGYSNTGSTVATRTAREDSRARLMIALADQIVTRLYATAL